MSDPDDRRNPDTPAGRSTRPALSIPGAATRRRPRWAVAAAGAMLLAGAGCTPASNTSAEATQTAAPAAVAETSPAGARSAGSASAIMPVPTSQHTVFHAEGLSGDAETAPVWVYDPTQSYTPERLMQLAQALGVDGEPHEESGAWWIGDRSAAYLTISADGTTSVTYHDAGNDLRGCDGTEPAPDGSGCSGGAPPVEEALERAREILRAGGLDPEQLSLDVPATDEPQGARVNVEAWREVGGERTGATWFFAFTGAGLQSFHGSLAPLVSLGEYRTVSPQDAVARLMDPRFGPLDGGVWTGGPRPTDPAPGPPAPPEPSDGPPAAPDPGEPVAWPVEHVTITEATQTLNQYTDPSGTTYLVPAYRLSSDDGGQWSVLALADTALDTSPTA